MRRLLRIIRVGLKCHHVCLYKRETEGDRLLGREDDVETEQREMGPQPRVAGSYQKLE